MTISYPYYYSKNIRALNTYNLDRLTLEFGDNPYYKFYNKVGLSNKQSFVNILDVFTNFELEYGAKFNIKGVIYYVNKDIILDENLNPIIGIRDGKMYYRNNVVFKHGLLKVFKAINSVYTEKISSSDFSELYYSILPVFKFKTIKSMREELKNISINFIAQNPSLFNKVV